MESFRITCTTCGRHLRVKDPRLIGQIVACPKCNAMVLIDRPASDDAGTADAGEVQSDSTTPPDHSAQSGPSAGAESHSGPASRRTAGRRDAPLTLGASEADSDAVTREGIAPPPPSSSDARKEIPDHAWNQADGEPIFEPGDRDRASAAAASEAGTQRKEVGPQVDAGPVDGAVPPVAWQSESSARTRQIVAVVTLAVLALLIAGTAFGLIIRSWRQDRNGVSAPLAGQDAAQSASPAGTPAADAPLGDPAGQPGGLADPDGDEQASPNEDTASESSIDGPDPAETDGEAEGTIENPDSGTEADDPNSESPVDAAVAGPIQGLDDPLFADSPAADGEDDDPDAGADQLPAGLQRYVPMLEMGKQPPVVGNPDDAPPTMEDLLVQRPGLALRESEYPAPADRVDVKENLRVRVQAFEAVDQPLDRLVRVLGQLGAVPIEFDLRAMDVAGIALDSPVSIAVSEIPAVNLLDQVVRRAGCRLTLQEGIVRIVPDNPTLSPALQAALQTERLEIAPDDLTNGLTRMLANGGDRSPAVQVEQDRVLIDEASITARVEAALVIEALRRCATGAEPASTPSLQDRWFARWDLAINERAADWQPLPDAPVVMDFHDPYAVDLILGQLARESDDPLAIDWTSAWSHGLTPAASDLPWLKNRKAFQVAKELLEPYGLVAFDTGQGGWWVGTREVYESMRIVGVLPSPLDAEATRARIAAAAGLALEAVPAIQEPKSGKWVVLLPRYVVRELPDVLNQP